MIVRRHRRAAVVLVVASLVAGALVLAAMGQGGRASAGATGPTAEASIRDLVTTQVETGTLERSDERIISHAGTITSSDGVTAVADGTTSPRPTTTTAPPSATVQPPTATPSATTGVEPAPSTPSTTTTTTAVSAAAAADAQGPASEGAEQHDPVVLTAVLGVGSDVARGTVLYTADDEPVAALLGDIPLWRELQQGVDAGADVRQLEQNLVDLGHTDVVVDERFTAATAAAVEAWEEDLGRSEPDGTVEIGDLLFLSQPGKVLSHEIKVGGQLEVGTPVLVVGSRQQIVMGDVAADQAAAWPSGSEVELTWTDGTTTTGTVFGVGREVTDDEVDLVITADDPDSERPTGAEVEIHIVDARREGVVAVPLAAIVQGGGGGRAVRVPTAGRADRLVPVTTGIVADGWIEIRSGLDAGTAVRLPG